MRHLLTASLIVSAIACAQPAAAQSEGPPVPVQQAAYHWPVFSNDRVIVLSVSDCKVQWEAKARVGLLTVSASKMIFQSDEGLD